MDSYKHLTKISGVYTYNILKRVKVLFGEENKRIWKSKFVYANASSTTAILYTLKLIKING